tara:strand:+ start:45 stop:326 length:282 start_codon:yes stop_codon:yes gene_type:complete
MAKYRYEVEEYSQDSRHYTIESNVMLTESQINESYSEVELVENSTSVLHGAEHNSAGKSFQKIKVTFKGTEYGDDSQVNIKGFDDKGRIDLCT